MEYAYGIAVVVLAAIILYLYFQYFSLSQKVNALGNMTFANAHEDDEIYSDENSDYSDEEDTGSDRDSVSEETPLAATGTVDPIEEKLK